MSVDVVYEVCLSVVVGAVERWPAFRRLRTRGVEVLVSVEIEALVAAFWYLRRSQDLEAVGPS